MSQKLDQLIAEVQGRLGQELLTIEVSGNLEDGLRIDIYQLTAKALDDVAPLVRIWRYCDDEPEEATNELEFDFDRIPVKPVTGEEHQLKHYVLKLKLPDDILTAKVEPGDPVYSVSIEGRDAPIRTTTFANLNCHMANIGIQFVNFRTISVVCFCVNKIR